MNKNNTKMTALEVFNAQAEIINKYGNIFDANNSFYEEYSSKEIETTLENYYKRWALDGDIWEVIFPFNGNDITNSKKRPCATIKIKGKMKAVYITKVEEKKSKERKLTFDWCEILNDWNTKQEGLPKKSIICGDTVRDIKDVILLKQYGRLTDRDYQLALQMVDSFNENRFFTPWTFVNWMLNNKVSDTIAKDGSNDNNVNQIQTLEDIDKSKKANCVDIAEAVHEICTKINIKHHIMILKFYKYNKMFWDGHVYTAFTANNIWYNIYYYSDNKKFIGMTNRYKTLQDLINDEIKRLKPVFSKKYGLDCRYENRMISDKEITLWDECVKQKKSQKEILQLFS